MTVRGDSITCDDDLCDAAIPNHRWAKTKAADWFFARDDSKAYCPDHIPEWVPAWRKRARKP